MNALVDDAPLPPPYDPEAAFSSKQPPLKPPLSLTPELDPPGADRLGLTPEEITQFREKGYVVKRGLIPKETFKPFHDLWWQQPPIRAAKLEPDKPESWVAPGRHWPNENRWSLPKNWMGNGVWPSPEDERLGANKGERVGRLPHKLTRDVGNYVWRWHGIGHDPAFVRATSAHPNVLYMIESILGGPVKLPHRNRGIYSVFPRLPDDPETRLGPHMDQNMTEMQVVTYIDDVVPRSGGFTIYPGSPQLLYPTSQQAHNFVATDASTEAMDLIKSAIQPIEFCGEAGDVIFCHGWVVHSAGIHEGDRIRKAVVQDFNRIRERGHMRWTAAGKNGGERINCTMDGIFKISVANGDDPSDGMREVTNQWIMDSNEFVLSRQPPFLDMFEEWNLGERLVEGNVVNEPPWWTKYNLPLLPTGSVPRGGGGSPAVPLHSVADYKGDGIWQVNSRANEWMRE